MDLERLDEWPSEPPQPTDLNQRVSAGQLPVRLCPYCDAELDYTEADDDEYLYVEHIGECERAEKCIDVSVTGTWGIVVPEQSGYAWSTCTNGFANTRALVQGTFIPLDTPQRYGDRSADVERQEELEGRFDHFDDPKAAMETYLRGLSEDPMDEYRGVDLGRKLIAETLDGTYADDEEVRERKFETRDERVAAVWEEIDTRLPFEYERVTAPRGRPLTREGIRWIDVQGRQGIYADDGVMSTRKAWIDALAERDEPVALFYPNSD